MKKEECYELGKVLRTHGLKGEISVILDVDEPSNYLQLSIIFIEIGTQLVPFTIKKIRNNLPYLTLQLEDITTIDQAREFVGCQLFLPSSILPELPEGEYYLHELIGCEIIDQEQGKLGHVKEIYDLPGQDLFAFNYQDQEVLVPIKDDIILHFDRQQKHIHTKLPDGLLEVYLNEASDKNS